jgi:hypothetical protein
MKKLAILFFFGALAVGVVGAIALPFGRVFDFNKVKWSWRGVEGSGNVVRERRNLGDFNSVEAGGAFLVEVTIGPEFSVEVEGDDNLVPLVDTVVRGDGVLHIESHKGYRSKNKIKIHITAPDLRGANASGAAQVTVNGINNEKFAIESSGGSRVNVTGKTGMLSVDISGGAKVLASELIATDGNVDSSGGATTEVNVTNHLNAEASGGSRIYYTGTPAKVDSNTSGGARVSQK